jgi:hypothetical protein
MSDSKHTIYERMFHSAVAALAEISDALGIPEDVASTANGNAEILHAIRALMEERDQLAAALEAARADGWQPIETAPNEAWLLVHSERGWIGLARRSDPGLCAR